MSTSLFVGGLSWGTTEQSLHQYLSSVAPVVSVKIPTDKMTGKSRGFAFVEMQSAEGTQHIIAQLNEREFEGRALHISPARQEETEACKLYVAGLAAGVTEDMLHTHLAAAGGVAKVSIVFDRDTQQSRGFAFVDTTSEADSEAIIAATNGSMLGGATIVVRKSRPRPEQPKRRFGNRR